MASKVAEMGEKVSCLYTLVWLGCPPSARQLHVAGDTEMPDPQTQNQSEQKT